ncbi:MAG: response regulator, partial [Desulfobacterales bacterium]|nr:response regulator [Desulfobacterales bacterium]
MASGERDRPDLIKLLLVDDEKGYTEVLSKRMSRREIDVAIALSGAEAIQT